MLDMVDILDEFNDDINIQETEQLLKGRIINSLEEQGFIVKQDSKLTLSEQTKEKFRKLQYNSKIEQLRKHIPFITKTTELAKKYCISGINLNPERIDLELRIVKKDTMEEKLFRWWNLIWWSMPYQQPYGRQMRFIIWDKGHDKPFGLISLQSPILKQAVRDKALGIPPETLDYWINRSMYAQRVGALPPYNYLLGGKMVALSLVSNEIRNAYQKKYQDNITMLEKRKLDSDLLFISTSSAFGKSSIYNRLKIDNIQIAENIGHTKGFGSFQIPDDIYKELITYLELIGEDVSRSYGDGPSRKMKLISLACRKLKLANYTYHGIKREYYIFPLAGNLREVIQEGAQPFWLDFNFKDLVDSWKDRWMFDRAKNNQQWRYFCRDCFIEDTKQLIGEIENGRETIR